MSKRFKNSDLILRRTFSTFAAFSLTTALALAGCTTNKMPGNGDPTPTGPLGSPAAASPAPGAGSSSGHGLRSDRLLSTGPAGETSRSLDALTTAAENQLYRGRVLGPAFEGPNPYAGTVVPPTGQFINPSLTANPQVTVNSSISSPATPVMIDDAAGGGGLFVATAASGGAGVAGAAGSSAAMTAAPTAATSAISTGAAITASSAALTTPTAATAGTGVRSGAVNAGISARSAAAAPVTTSGRAITAGAVLASNARGAAVPVATSVTGVQVAGTSGPSVDPAVVPSGVAVPPAPGVTTAATVATPANAASIVTPGMYAAGPGGATAIYGNRADVNQTLANTSPLPLTSGTSLANGNTGTLTPTINSASTPSPTLASNPPVAGTNGTTFPAGVRASRTTTAARSAVTASGAPSVLATPVRVGARSGVPTGVGNVSAGAVIAPMTSSSDEAVTTSTGRVRAATAPAAAVTAPATASGTSRARASRVGGSVSAPATVPATARGRAVRLTTAPDGSIVVTNVKQ